MRPISHQVNFGPGFALSQSDILEIATIPALDCESTQWLPIAITRMKKRTCTSAPVPPKGKPRHVSGIARHLKATANSKMLFSCLIPVRSSPGSHPYLASRQTGHELMGKWQFSLNTNACVSKARLRACGLVAVGNRLCDSAVKLRYNCFRMINSPF
jgi:hypothetical protein